MLALHDDVQEKVFGEISSAVAPNEGMIDIETLHRLTFLETVIKETMRLFPVVPVFGREATDDFVLEGRTIPKGALLISSIFYLHRSKKYWGDDAHLFRPERFGAESLKNIHPYAFVPFTGEGLLLLCCRTVLRDRILLIVVCAVCRWEADLSGMEVHDAFQEGISHSLPSGVQGEHEAKVRRTQGEHDTDCCGPAKVHDKHREEEQAAAGLLMPHD
jgi:hypothetical protein